MGSNEERRLASDNKIKELLPEYYSGKYVSTREFIKEFSLSSGTFFNYLKRHNLESLRHTTRKYHLDTTFFEDIDTEAKAYWLGFLQCDAHISHQNIDIVLQVDDEAHLHKLADALGFDGSITHRTIANKYVACRLCICSIDLIKPLEYIGLDKFRSETMQLLLNYKHPQFKHYIRGIIDANGSICTVDGPHNSTRINYFEITSGSLVFVEGIKDGLNNLYGIGDAISIRRDVRKDSVYKCSFRKLAYMTILEEIYKDAKISLDRKQEKVNAVLYGSTKNI